MQFDVTHPYDGSHQTALIRFSIDTRSSTDMNNKHKVIEYLK